MDLNYLKYQLKCFLLSDFKINETKLILNSQEPETFCRTYLSSLKLKKEHETALRLQFRKLIDTAYEHRIPLGQDLFDCADLEEAYLKRQQYLAFITQKYQLLSLFNKLILLAITASIAILLVL